MELQLHDQDYCTAFKIFVFIKLFSTTLVVSEPQQ